MTMTREQNRQQLINLFLHGDISIRDVINLTYDHADSHPQWIPVEEELPKEQGKYMFRLSNGDMCYETYYPKLKLVVNVTHWMKIQPPRKEEE